MRHAALLLAAALSACQWPHDYVDPGSPRFHGAPPAHLMRDSARDTLRIVSFNIQFAMRIERALQVLLEEPELRDADILLLQEMDAPGTRYIARRLGMWYVYYPASRHLRHGRDFGNAVLSRWPIVADGKIVLPHKGRLYGTRRTATAATIRIGNDSLRVYSAHLGTHANISPRQRREQLQAVLADAAPFAKVVIGGDMNDARIAETAQAQGYAWPTEHGPRTAAIGRLDHIIVRGLSIPETGASGTVLDVRGASDHRPVWTIVIKRTP